MSTAVGPCLVLKALKSASIKAGDSATHIQLAYSPSRAAGKLEIRSSGNGNYTGDTIA